MHFLFKLNLTSALALLSCFTLMAQADEGWPPDCTREIVRFRQVNPDLFRGGQPKTLEDLQCLKTVGVKTVISLIIEDPDLTRWEQIHVTELGMLSYSFPMSGILPPSNQQVARIFHELLNPDQFPVYIHCMHGKDRTGLMVGLYRVWVDHWTSKEAWKEMRQIGFDPKLVGLTGYFWSHAKGPAPWGFANFLIPPNSANVFE